MVEGRDTPRVPVSVGLHQVFSVSVAQGQHTNIAIHLMLCCSMLAAWHYRGRIAWLYSPFAYLWPQARMFYFLALTFRMKRSNLFWFCWWKIQLCFFVSGFVFVNSLTNLAETRPAFQSSTYTYHTLLGPEKAVGRFTHLLMHTYFLCNFEYSFPVIFLIWKDFLFRW